MKREKNPVDNEIYLSLDNINVDYAVKDVRFKLNEQASKPLGMKTTAIVGKFKINNKFSPFNFRANLHKPNQ